MPRGRPVGSAAKATLQRERVLAKDGLMPRDYLLGIMRDEGEEKPTRIDAAKAAAPYCHPRLAQIDANHSGSIDVRAWLAQLGEPD